MKEKAAAGLIVLSILVALPSIAAAASAAGEPAGRRLPTASPEAVGMSSQRLAKIDDAVAEGLQQHKMPGCVVMICRRGAVVFEKAYGDRQVLPERIPMTTDTLFDLASLTKPIATATSVMILVERGKLRLDEPVADVIPDFGSEGKQQITLFQLLTHQSGLIADNRLSDYEDGPAQAWQRISAQKLVAKPGEKFIYSDVNYLVLGELVGRAAGEGLRQFTQENIFQPLGMTETGYLPGEALRRRAAPTERRDDRWMQGEVHDPRAYLLGGVAGHAGLFSTAADLAVFAQMMLGEGEYCGVRILSRESVAKMTTPYPVSSGRRGLSWDIKTGYSSNRSPAYSERAFGHGGFTGTSLWIDPARQLEVIFLSNRLHPDGKGVVNPLAARIGTIAVEAIEDGTEASEDTKASKDTKAAAVKNSPLPLGEGTSAAAGQPVVLTGIDVLKRDHFAPLQGRHIGLITNHTGIDRQGASTVKLLHEAPGVDLVALFSPEHGIEGTLDVSRIADSRDPASGLPIHSLYNKNRRPSAESLRGIDTLVFDIQDIGTRFYTYISTMGNAMRAAAEHKLRFVVLDRPNPINGCDVAGPLLDAGRESFVGFFRLPVRHGMTVGELAGLFNDQLRLGLDLQVIRMEGWRRDLYYDATGLKWINPSPNMRNLTEAILYPGVGLLETTNLSVGRGTDTPFELVGAPWLDGPRLADALSAAGLPGVGFTAATFTPESSKFQSERCQGVRIEITDRKAFEPIRTGLEMAHQLQTLYPKKWDAAAYGRLLGNQQVLAALQAGKPVAEIEALYAEQLREFRTLRARYLLYEGSGNSEQGTAPSPTSIPCPLSP